MSRARTAETGLSGAWMALSGATGVALSGLVYALAGCSGLTLKGRVDLGIIEPFVLLGLLAISLLEIPVMVFGLRTMAKGKPQSPFFYAINAFYVSFAAFYALILIVLFGDSVQAGLLAALSLARWASDWWIR